MTKSFIYFPNFHHLRAPSFVDPLRNIPSPRAADPKKLRTKKRDGAARSAAKKLRTKKREGTTRSAAGKLCTKERQGARSAAHVLKNVQPEERSRTYDGGRMPAKSSVVV